MMNWKSFPLLLTTFVFASLQAPFSATANANQASSPSVQLAQARSRRSPVIVTFNPPRRGAPPATVGLGSRGDCIENRDDSLTALVPVASASPTEAGAAETGSTPLGLTTAPRPTLLVYVPVYHNSTQALSMRLMRVTEDDQEVELYAQTFALPTQSGIVRLRPADSMPSLAVNQQYHWYVSMVCNSVDQSGNAVVDGWIERIEPDAVLSRNLEQAEPIRRAVLYGQAGIWHDTLLTLVDLYRAQPGDSVLRSTWQNLLQSVGLGAIAEAPLIECCQPLD